MWGTKSAIVDVGELGPNAYFIMFCNRRRPSEEAITASVNIGDGFLSPAESRGVPGTDAGKFVGKLVGKIICSPLTASKPPAILSQYRSDRQVIKNEVHSSWLRFAFCCNHVPPPT